MDVLPLFILFLYIVNMSRDGWFDLHLHTTHSDRLYSPEQLVQAAVEKNYGRYIADKYGIQLIVDC